MHDKIYCASRGDLAHVNAMLPNARLATALTATHAESLALLHDVVAEFISNEELPAGMKSAA